MDENQIDIYCSEHECVTRAYQEAKVCVPITVTPFANVGILQQNAVERL